MNWIWSPTTHIQLCKLALSKMSPFFNELISVYPEYFELGIIAPDRLFCDTTNHYYNCTPSPSGYHYGCVLKKILKEIELIENMIENRDSLIYHPNCSYYLKHILDNPLKILIFEMGVISHYIADLHQPFHTDGKYRFGYEEVPHKIYEADVRKHFGELQLDVGKRRYHIPNLGNYLYETIYRINKSYDTLIDYYFLTPNKVKADRWEKAESKTEKFLSSAAKCIANIWFPFESQFKVYKKLLKNIYIMQEVDKALTHDGNYSLKIYNSGTMSIRRKK